MTATDLLQLPDWQPIDRSQLRTFITYCEEKTHESFPVYSGFEAFTMTQFRAFWALFLGWSRIIYEGAPDPVCVGDDCETATFFPSLRLNYAENLLRYHNGSVLVGCHSGGGCEMLTGGELREKVILFAEFLQHLGIEPGDRVVAIARNNIEVIIAALGSAAIGAVFSSCSHDMGAATVLSRFQRLMPKILVANCASRPGDVGKPLEERISEVVAGLPSLTAVIGLDGKPQASVRMFSFEQTVGGYPAGDFVWQRFPFNHPLFILFSSGTTGTPKCIVHGAGGTLLEHVKEHLLHGDLTSNDCMFFQTSCGWMMWNWQLSALACGAKVVVYDGPLKGPETLWEIVADQQVTVFGTNPAYLQFTETAGYSPNVLNLAALRSVLSTGSILHPNQFDWVVQQVKRVPVQSISGGTDILGCFVLGNPLLPVYRGQAQCRSLGLDVRSLPPEARIGELVCVNPFPSRPIGFYGETSNVRYHKAYFAKNEGVWTHGDLIEFTEHGAIMHGRSDGVINIRGVRIGPAEIYRILRQIPTIVEAMAVEQSDEKEAGGSCLILLVVLPGGTTLDAALITRIRTTLMDQGTPTMVPAAIVQMNELPVTHSGKRSEVAARDAVNGLPIRNREALLNPDSLDGLAGRIMTSPSASDEISSDLELSLCMICQRFLHVPVVHSSDNFLAFGGDSLAILGFLIEVSARTQTSLPLSALIGVSTISELARLLHTGVAVRSRQAGPQVRVAEKQDEEEICRFLDQGFRRRFQWRRIFDHPWQPDAIPRGFVLTAGNDIVGFLGLICAERNLDGKLGIIGNLTSWYVRPGYRGWSNALITAATQFDITYTSLTPGGISRRILEAMGFTTLDATILYSPPLDACQDATW